MGGDFFTRSLHESGIALWKALNPQARHQPAHRPGSERGVCRGSGCWVAELKRQLNEWFEHNAQAAPEAAAFELVASGGGFDQPGLLDYLKTQTGLELKPWPKGNQPDAVLPSKRFEVAFGAALQALGQSAQPVLAAARRLPRRLAETAQAPATGARQPRAGGALPPAAGIRAPGTRHRSSTGSKPCSPPFKLPRKLSKRTT